MGFFRRTQPTEDREYMPPPLDVYERADDMPMGGERSERTPIAFAPKPDELVRGTEWTRPVATRSAGPDEGAWTVPQTLPWTLEPPTSAGFYWYREIDTAPVHGAVVLRFGGSLSVRRRRGDAALYVSVAALKRAWSGPVPIPAGVELELMECA